MPNVLTAVRDSVLIVTINRPERRNAVDGETAQALAAAFRDFDQKGTLRVAILSSAGGTFCAGADLKANSRQDEAISSTRPAMGRWDQRACSVQACAHCR